MICAAIYLHPVALSFVNMLVAQIWLIATIFGLLIGHRRLAPTVVTVAVVITSTLIAAIRVAVAFSLPRCPLVAYFSGARPSYR